MPKKSATRIHPRLRVYARDEIALGPGKAELLEHIAETGSLSEAARRMKMSYMKCWLLVQVMNKCFRKPLIVAERGGSGGGGAQLSKEGEQVLTLYREMEAASVAAMKQPWSKLQKMLQDSPSSD